MKFGLAYANTGPFGTRRGAEALTRAAEKHGFESLWTVEHVVVPAGYESVYPYSGRGRMPGAEDSPIPDPLVFLAFAAAHSENLRLGTAVLILPQRNPPVLAKEIATLDTLSGGRVILGVGVGWLEEEFAALHVPFGERGTRTDEAISALRALWTQAPASHDGPRYGFSEVHSEPKPLQAGGVPIHVGGHTLAAAMRAGRLGDGFMPISPAPARLPVLIEAMRVAAQDAGRDPDAIEVSTGVRDLAQVRELEQVGVRRVLVTPPTFDPDAIDDALARLADEATAAV